MTRHAIIEKLDRELQEPGGTNWQVVYILVELRKLMERNGDADRYLALNLYCDWAVHTKMDRTGATRIVERFNQCQELIELGLGRPHWCSQDPHTDSLHALCPSLWKRCYPGRGPRIDTNQAPGPARGSRPLQG